MKKSPWILGVLALLLMAGTAAYLVRQRSHQRLGNPGVKVVAQLVYGTVRRAEATNQEPPIVRTNAVFLPEKVLAYASMPAPIQPVVLDTLPPDTLFGHRIYQRPDGFTLDYQVVLMGGDRSSIHQPQHCLTGNGLTILSEERVSIPVTQPHAYDLPVNKLKLRGHIPTRDGGRQEVGAVFVYWFVAEGQMTADHGQRMWSIAKELLRTGVLQRWAYVICYAPCPLGQEDATFERMREFIAASVPEFQLAHGPPVARVSRR